MIAGKHDQELAELVSGADPTRQRVLRLGQALSFKRIGAVYVWGALIVLFAIWVPSTFLTVPTVRIILTQGAITGLLAVGLVIPMAAGAFDVSVGSTLGGTMMFLAWLTGLHGWSTPAAIAATFAFGLFIGSVNGYLVAVVGIDSFIATLGTGSLLTGFATATNNGQVISTIPTGILNISQTEFLTVPLFVWYLLVLAIIVWYMLQQTPVGRYLQAVGSGREAARLAGIHTERYVFSSLVVSALIATLAGVVTTGWINSGDPTVGPTYLLPAFAATFLGSTQIANGRFNVWGTLIATYLIATGTHGFTLAGASFWVNDVFSGAALIIAVGLSVRRRRTGRQWLSRLIGRGANAGDPPNGVEQRAAGGRRSLTET